MTWEKFKRFNTNFKRFSSRFYTINLKRFKPISFDQIFYHRNTKLSIFDPIFPRHGINTVFLRTCDNIQSYLSKPYKTPGHFFPVIKKIFISSI